MIFKLLGIIAVVLAGAQASQASVIGLDAFSGEETLIDFNGIQPNESVTTQFASHGLYVFGGAFGDPFPDSSINGSRELTNFGAFAEVSMGLVLAFDHLVHRAGFFATQFGEYSVIGVRAYRAGNEVFSNAYVVGQDVVPGGTLASVFAGLEVGGGFDQLLITAEVRMVRSRTIRPAFSMDDLRFESLPAVPLPAGIVLLGAGVVGLGALSRRRTRKSRA